MDALAREVDVTAIVSENWAAYVRRVTRDLTADGWDRNDIAAAADVNPSALSRWITGVTPCPNAEKVISFARGLKQDPVQALVAAGYLRVSELDNPTEIVQSLDALSDDAFLDALRDRLRRAADQVQPGAAKRLGAKLNRNKLNRKGMSIEEPEDSGEERL